MPRAGLTVTATALALVIAAAAALLPVVFVDAKTNYVLNLDHWTFWKTVRPGRLFIVKFDVEYPHGERQDAFNEMASELAFSHGVEAFVGEIRIKAGEEGGRSENIPLWKYHNCSIYNPPHTLALIPAGRVEWSKENIRPEEHLADDDEFNTDPDTMAVAHKHHRVLRIDVNVSEQFQTGLGARWINAILRRYPQLTHTDRLGYPTAKSQAVPRSVLGTTGNTTRAGTAFVNTAGIPADRCQRLASGPKGWAAMLAELEVEADKRRDTLVEKARLEAEFKARVAEELAAREREEAERKAAENGVAGNETELHQSSSGAADAEGGKNDTVAAAATLSLQEEIELQRVENTNDGKKQREEAKRQARLHRTRTWLMDLLRKLLDLPRFPAKPLPRSRHAENPDRAALVEEIVPESARASSSGAAAIAPGPHAFASYERVRAEERKLRAIARDEDVSRFARVRADVLLSALWCTRRHFLFGDKA